jgi:hypothetical protein
MKKLAILGLLALELAVSGCGKSNTTTTTAAAGGIWQATLTGGAGDAGALDFITSFTVNGDNSLSVASVVFLTNNPGACFVSGSSGSGTLDITSGTNTTVTGTFNFTVTSGTPSGNTLTLSTGSTGAVTGTLNGSTLTGGSITGGWTLTGGAGSPDCTGSGSFTLKQS